VKSLLELGLVAGQQVIENGIKPGVTVANGEHELRARKLLKQQVQQRVIEPRRIEFQPLAAVEAPQLFPRPLLGDRPIRPGDDDTHEAFELGLVPCPVMLREHGFEGVRARLGCAYPKDVEAPGFQMWKQPIAEEVFDFLFDRVHSVGFGSGQRAWRSLLEFTGGRKAGGRYLTAR